MSNNTERTIIPDWVKSMASTAVLWLLMNLFDSSDKKLDVLASEVKAQTQMVSELKGSISRDIGVLDVRIDDMERRIQEIEKKLP